MRGGHWGFGWAQCPSRAGLGGGIALIAAAPREWDPLWLLVCKQEGPSGAICAAWGPICSHSGKMGSLFCFCPKLSLLHYRFWPLVMMFAQDSLSACLVMRLIAPASMQEAGLRNCHGGDVSELWLLARLCSGTPLIAPGRSWSCRIQASPLKFLLDGIYVVMVFREQTALVGQREQHQGGFRVNRA